jgi:hypothetical protein
VQVDIQLLSIHDHIGAGGSHEFHGGDLDIIEVTCPVVDLYTGHHGVVGTVGVHCLADKVLQVLRV